MDTPRKEPDFPESLRESGPFADYERHSLGRFGEKVIEFLGRGDRFGEVSNHKNFIVVDSIELGDNSFEEELGIKFHLSETPSPPDHVPFWGVFPPSHPVTHRLTPGMRPVDSESRLFFTFTSAISFEENIQEFIEFIKDEIEEASSNPDRQDGTTPPLAGESLAQERASTEVTEFGAI